MNSILESVVPLAMFIFVPANPRWIGGYEILIFHCDSALFPDDDINLHICDIVRNSAGNMIWIVQKAKQCNNQTIVPRLPLFSFVFIGRDQSWQSLEDLEHNHL